MKNLLVVDDSKTILKTAKLVLEDKYNVYLANSGKMALDIVEKNPIDFVLMDVDMPEMNGIDAVRAIREIEALKDLPVIFFTALSSKEIVTDCINVGMSGYIVKPYKPDVLIEKIKSVLGEN
ncbi:MAG: response regulator [Clostridiales bacterium]|nr:response regulator [Clostridiales bacterium]